jgi:uncharacterized protein YutE (UPF0331/DUF86 family)
MERILQKIGRINEYLTIIEKLKDDCPSRFDKDSLYRGALLHYLYLMADTSITLAEMVIKKKKFRTPQSYSEAFDILGENNILDPQFAYSFAKIAGFRNFLAHDYETVDAGIICQKVLSSTSDVKHYVEQIEKHMKHEF